MRFDNAAMFSAYPTFKDWLYELAPRVKRHRKLLDALVTFGKSTEDEMIETLSLGRWSPPRLRVSPFSNARTLRLGLTVYLEEEDTDLMIVNQGMLQLFEKDASWGRIIEATMLHELVHRALTIAKDPNADHDDSAGDAGLKFERAAYGEVVGPTCPQETALRRVTNYWERDDAVGVSGVFNFYENQCGEVTPEPYSRLKPW